MKPALVLIHGHGVDASIWNGIYASLLVDFTVLKPDFAHTATHKTIEAYAEALYAQLQAASIQAVILVGHSMGGYIALAFAERYPSMVRGLALYHSTAYADDESRKTQRYQVINTMKANGAAPFIEKQLPKMVAPTYPAAKTQSLIDQYRNLPVDALIAGMEAIAERPDCTAVLRQAQFPIWLVAGREDQLIPFEKIQPLAQLSDQIRLVPIEQAGHLSMIEQPEVSLNLIRDFASAL